MEPHWARPPTCRPSRRSADQLDTRTDLFSFGILLYEMCTGRSPFPGDTTGELLIAIVQQVQITPAQLNPDVPDGLARIIDRCLEKDRELRYQHAGEIRADLKRLQHNSAELVDAPSPGSQIDHRHASSGSRTFEALPHGGEIGMPADGQPKPAEPALSAAMADTHCRAADRCRRAAGLSPDAPPARAEGLKLRPAHPRRSAEGPGRHRWFAALSWFCQNHHLQRLRRHHADVCLGGRAGPDSGGFQSRFSL